MSTNTPDVSWNFALWTNIAICFSIAACVVGCAAFLHSAVGFWSLVLMLFGHSIHKDDTDK